MIIELAKSAKAASVVARFEMASSCLSENVSLLTDDIAATGRRSRDSRWRAPSFKSSCHPAPLRENFLVCAHFIHKIQIFNRVPIISMSLNSIKINHEQLLVIIYRNLGPNKREIANPQKRQSAKSFSNKSVDDSHERRSPYLFGWWRGARTRANP